MTHDRFLPAADEELLSAYLLGDLNDAEARDFEARLATEPGLVAQLDALAAALVTLGGHDRAQPPAGFEDRLAAALDRARDGAEVVGIDAARERRARSRGWWTAVGTAAAVVAVGGVMATNVLRDVGGGADIATGDDAMQSDTSATLSLESADEGSDGDRAIAGGALARPTRPELLDAQAVVRDESALQARYADAVEVNGLLGLPLQEAESVAADFTAAVERAEPFATAGSPAACLDTVNTGAEQPLIPARIETLRYLGQPAVAYVLVTASPDSPELDRVETWVLTPGDCSTLVFQQR
jgi:anti-sigma factor RsiW